MTNLKPHFTSRKDELWLDDPSYVPQYQVRVELVGATEQLAAEIADALNRRAHDASETAALRKVRDEMARCDAVVVAPWLAALDAILKGRK